MMAGVVLLSTVELAWLIGIESVHTKKIYIVERAIHLEAMLAVALISLTFGYYLVAAQWLGKTRSGSGE